MVWLCTDATINVHMLVPPDFPGHPSSMYRRRPVAGYWAMIRAKVSSLPSSTRDAEGVVDGLPARCHRSFLLNGRRWVICGLIW